MSELSPRGQALLHASRAALRPHGTDRQRVLATLRERLGGAALVGGVGKAQAAAHSSLAMWAVSAAAMVGVGAAVAVGMSVERSPAVSSLAAPALASAPAPLSSVSDAASAQLPPAVQPEASSAPAAPSMPSRRGADRLAEEVAILSQAAKDLRAGRAADALSALNEHQKRFPGGLLTQERRAARAEALCSLGRFSEAQGELSMLGRSAPHSPLLVRAKERCQARSPKAP
jgi:hypothetical protein